MIPIIAQATPIPAFAPVESPLWCEEDELVLPVESGGLPGARLVDVGSKAFVHVIDPPGDDGTVCLESTKPSFCIAGETKRTGRV